MNHLPRAVTGRRELTDEELVKFHHHLAHVGPRAMYRVLSMLGYIVSTSRIEKVTAGCDCCLMGKYRVRKPPAYDEDAVPSASRRPKRHNDLVCGDTHYFGKGHDNPVWYMLDDHSRYLMVVPLKAYDSEEVIEAWQEWRSKFGLPETVIMDNINAHKRVCTWLKERGVRVREIAVYAPWSNGKVERVHDTVKQRMRAVLYSLGLPFSKVWLHVMNWVVKIHNNTPHHHKPSMTPSQASRKKTSCQEFQQVPELCFD